MVEQGPNRSIGAQGGLDRRPVGNFPVLKRGIKVIAALMDPIGVVEWFTADEPAFQEQHRGIAVPPTAPITPSLAQALSKQGSCTDSPAFQAANVVAISSSS